MIWSPQQDEALAKCAAWLRMRYHAWFYLGGYAGTGKTTLAIHMAQHANGPVAFMSFTGKAARVMRSKGCKGARTIHSSIYHTEQDEEMGESVSTLAPDKMKDFVLIIVDEVSMVNEALGNDLLSFGIPVLVLGDPAQLPPVSGEGFFTSKEPDYMLTEVHRQAAESPILRLASEIRHGKRRFDPINTDGLIICSAKDVQRPWVQDANMVIVGKNLTRQRYNQRLRELKNIKGDRPIKGEPIMCLRNETFLGISNGEIFEIVTGKKMKTVKGNKVLQYVVRDPDDDGRKPVTVAIRPEFFLPDDSAKDIPWRELKGTQRFTYGYVITAHKAQGSQWDDVCVFDQSRSFGQEGGRWLYTACTRASKHLTLVTS